jgi:hypothetical protein
MPAKSSTRMMWLRSGCLCHNNPQEDGPAKEQLACQPHTTLRLASQGDGIAIGRRVCLGFQEIQEFSGNSHMVQKGENSPESYWSRNPVGDEFCDPRR